MTLLPTSHRLHRYANLSNAMTTKQWVIVLAVVGVFIYFVVTLFTGDVSGSQYPDTPTFTSARQVEEYAKRSCKYDLVRFASIHDTEMDAVAKLEAWLESNDASYSNASYFRAVAKGCDEGLSS